MMHHRFLFVPLVLLVHAQLHSAEPDNPAVLQPQIARYTYHAIPKDPLASAFFSLTLPGSGQLYNREYGRALALGVPFWAGVVVTEVMIRRWEVMNLDTFYLRETNAANTEDRGARMVIAARQDKDLEGLPGPEKLILGAAVGACGISWIWGIIDAYHGANRYNSKLVLSESGKPGIDLAWDPSTRSVGAVLNCGF